MQLLSPVKKIKTPIFVTTHKLRGITERCLVQKILRYIFHAKPHSFTAFTRGLPSSEKILGRPHLLYQVRLCTGRCQRLQ